MRYLKTIPAAIILSLSISCSHIGGHSDEPSIRELTEMYVQTFDEKNLEGVTSLFAEDIAFNDPKTAANGKAKVSQLVVDIFKNTKKLSFSSKGIYVSGDTSILEFRLVLDGVTLDGVDVFEWKNGKISKLRAYLDLQ